jgi:hypothetical protein
VAAICNYFGERLSVESREFSYPRVIVEWMIAAALALGCAACNPRSATQNPPTSSPSVASQAVAPAFPSGIYGFSGAGAPYGEPMGVIGECVWVFDERDNLQVAKGQCAESAPGHFRVILKPGRYMVHGPGGNRSVEVKPGVWVKLESIASLPLAP